MHSGDDEATFEVKWSLNMKHLKSIVLFLLFFQLSAAEYPFTDMVAVSTEYLYPYSQFYHIEAICKSVWSDLDLYLTHEPFEQLAEKIPLLKKNLEQLVHEVKRMVFNCPEAASFLPEDTIYLMRMVTVLANKYRLVCQKIKDCTGEDISIFSKRFEEMRMDLEFLRESRDEIALLE